VGEAMRGPTDLTAPIPEWRQMMTVEGIPLIGGPARVRVRLIGAQGQLLEVSYPAGAQSPEHAHQHDSYIYLLSGRLIGTVAGQPVELEPGETLLHPAGVPHALRAVTESHWLEFKGTAQANWG
jgi:quercetin dioxygenase-like cupin family protein